MIEIAPVDVLELGRLVAIRNKARPDDPGTIEGLVDWRRQAEDMVWLVATDDGVDVGAGLGLIGWHSRPGTATVEAWTAPEARGRGVGQALYVELSRWAAQRGSVELQTSVAEHDRESYEWADHRGFREIGRELRVSLDVRTIDAPDIAPPEGITVVPWDARDDLAHGMYEVYVEADPDIPGSDGVAVPSFEEWLHDDMQGSSDRPEAVFVAQAGDEVVGYAKLSLPEQSTGTAWHDLTAVKRAWRGRGIASALKRAQIRWAKEHGFERLTTMNEERNAPIRHLNAVHGYQPEPGRIILATKISLSD